MATSLKDIPGANRPRKRRRAERALWHPSRPTTLDLTPGSLRISRARGSRFLRPSTRIDLFLVLLVLGAIGVAVWLLSSFWSATRVHVDTAGLHDGRALQPAAAEKLDVAITLASSEELFRANLTLDGVPLLDDLKPEADGRTVRVRPAQHAEQEVVEQALAEGEHTIDLSVKRMFLGDSTFHWSYVVDSIAPTLDLPATLAPVPIDAAVTVSGTVEDGVELRFRGEAVKSHRGKFDVDFDSPPTGGLEFTATDEAGNQTKKHVVVPVVYPHGSKAVHVSAAAWANDGLRAGVMDLIDRHLIDTVELDLKDEHGVIGYDSKLPKARQIGAVSADYDLAATVRLLEAKGVRVIGRLVAFRDPLYAGAAWDAGHRDEVIQTPSGGMLGTYNGGFANYANPSVRKYNLDVALEAVHLGVKDILWDYIRRPEGDPSTMVVPGLVGPSSTSVASFLAASHAKLRAAGAFQGASVFGIAAASGDSIGQDVPAMAMAADYLAPMIYPSHWGPGQYRVKSPINEPFEITKRSLTDFQRVTEGTGVRFLPWVQDFTLYGVVYGPAEVKAQIDAAASLGIDGFMLWNPNVRYHPDALTPLV